jgi:hypothetical protein
MRFLDWINENPWLIVIAIILTFCLRCSSGPEASTIRLQERSVSVINDLDLATNECLTQECKERMTRAKELIKDSLDIAIEKDSIIQQKQKQIDSQSLYTSIGRGVVWGAISLLIIGLLFIFRNQILTILKSFI